MNKSITEIISNDIRRVGKTVVKFTKLFLGGFVILGVAGAVYLALLPETTFYFAVVGLLAMWAIRIWGRYLGLP